MEQVSIGKLHNRKLYVLVCNHGVQGVRGNIIFENGVSDPVSGYIVKNCRYDLPNPVRAYPFPCDVIRGYAHSYKVNARNLDSNELPALPDMELVELPETLPTQYRELMSKYKRSGRGYKLKDAKV